MIVVDDEQPWLTVSNSGEQPELMMVNWWLIHGSMVRFQALVWVIDVWLQDYRIMVTNGN